MSKTKYELAVWVAMPTHRVDEILGVIGALQNLPSSNPDHLLHDLDTARSIFAKFKVHLFELLNPTFISKFYGEQVDKANGGEKFDDFNNYCKNYEALPDKERFEKIATYPVLQDLKNELLSLQKISAQATKQFVNKKQRHRLKHFFIYFVMGLTLAFLLDLGVSFLHLDSLLKKITNEYIIDLLKTATTFTIGKYLVDRYLQNRETNALRKRLQKEYKEVKELSSAFANAYDLAWSRIGVSRTEVAKGYLSFMQELYK